MIQTVADFIYEKQLFLPTDRILVAVSGGCDSIVLFDVLRKLGFDIGIAHCNFQLRGEESEADELFVQTLAQQYKIPYFVTRFDTQNYAEQKNVSIQIAARELRYMWFEKVAQEENYTYIATAHHLNDTIETILHRLARGTGIVGLQGIPAQNDRIVRPLLAVAQAEIRKYALQNQLVWREDSSNAADKYTRNKIRHKIVPIFQELNPNFEHTFSHTLERLQGYARHFQASLEALKAQIFTQKNQISYIQILPLLQQEAGKIFLEEILQDFGFQYTQTCLIWEKMQSHAIGASFFSPTHNLVVDREALIFKPIEVLPENEEFWLEQGQASLQTPYFTLELEETTHLAYPNHHHQVLLASETLQFPLHIRRWQAGDYFCPLGMQGRKKKVADFLNDQKVPRHLKNEVWVLVSGKDIIWVMGYRISHLYSLQENTQKALSLSMKTLIAYWLAFDITFYQSLDNYAEQRFTYAEQHWVLKENKLAYKITERQTVYADTLTLSEEQITKLHTFFTAKKLYQNIDIKKLKAQDGEMEEYKNEILCHITYQNTTYKHNLQGVYGTLDHEKQYQNLLKLRDLLFELIAR
jgi:tRNA(Ile)-lysidine synthase